MLLVARDGGRGAGVTVFGAMVAVSGMLAAIAVGVSLSRSWCSCVVGMKKKVALHSNHHRDHRKRIFPSSQSQVHGPGMRQHLWQLKATLFHALHHCHSSLRRLLLVTHISRDSLLIFLQQ